MIRVVTVHTGDAYHRSPFFMRIHDRLAEAPPDGFTILLHACVEEFCEQILEVAPNLASLEIVSHGNPGYLGVIDDDNLERVARALAKAPAACELFLAGCNTGTYGYERGTGRPETFNIATRLAALAPCKVYGAMGYVNSGTLAERTIACSTDDWEQHVGHVYHRAKDANGRDVFERKRSR